MAALVTGGGGFIGRAIVFRLLERGEAVRVVGRRRYPDLERLGVESVAADIADAAAIRQACRGIETIHHTAACVELWHAPDELRRTNVEGTRQVLAAAREAGVARLVFTSSASVVFGHEDQIDLDESAPYPVRFTNLYAETKAAAERLVLEADGRGGLRTLALRPHLVWGPGDTHLIPNLLARARSGGLIQVGDGRNRVDITYIDNLADLHVRAGDCLAEAGEAAGRSFFVSQGEPVLAWSFFGDLLARLGFARPSRAISFRRAYAIGALCEAVWKLGSRRGAPPMTRFLAAQMAKSHYFDISAARRILGYRATVSTAEGIERVVAAFAGAASSSGSAA